jgi:hypothetical protein
MMKRIVLLVAMLAMLVFLAAPVALAQGQIERGPEHARSICSFSGQNDTPDDPEEGGRVQSYGQIVAAGFKAEVPSPGFACNPEKGPFEGPFTGDVE